MTSPAKNILVINGGSSSLKFAIYTNLDEPETLISGKIERIGSNESQLHTEAGKGVPPQNRKVPASNMQEAADAVIEFLRSEKELDQLAAVGHRLVHGMQFTDPQIISDTLLSDLQKIESYDPDHLPDEIALIRSFQKLLPGLPQVACFDTNFHKSIPRIAAMLPLPKKFADQGIHKYGFHGLSYQYIIGKLKQLDEPAANKGRLIIAHLGNGASMAAIRDGISVDTSMGFTPTAGLVMSTRTGDLDPGLVSVIMRMEKMDADAFNQFVNKSCGLLGVSGTSSDMQDLLGKENTDTHAADAVNLFCYQAKKWIGSFTAVLNGLDVLVFTGGIGEHAPEVRKRICMGFDFLNLQLDDKKNQENAPIISSAESRVVVYVLPTNEEYMIAKEVNNIVSKKLK